MDFSPFVGLPWKDLGRGPDGFDCWGVFLIAFEAGTGIVLPSHADGYASSTARAETALVVAGELGDWTDVQRGREREFDAAVMKIAGGFHIGLVTRPGQILHMPHGRTSVIEPLARYNRVITGLYRYEKGGTLA